MVYTVRNVLVLNKLYGITLVKYRGKDLKLKFCLLFTSSLF